MVSTQSMPRPLVIGEETKVSMQSVPRPFVIGEDTEVSMHSVSRPQKDSEVNTEAPGRHRIDRGPRTCW